MSNPVDARVVGQALESRGFIGDQKAIAGLGLNSFGFIWPCDAIWTDTDSVIVTAWSDVASASSVEDCIG
jgi:hypothetical protein